MATLKPTVINGGGTTAPLILKNGDNGYKEGLRIIMSKNWSDIVLGGSGLSETANISNNSWFIGNNDGKFYITRGGSSSPYSGGAQIKCESNAWTITGNTTFLNNVSSFNMTGYLTFENGGALGYGPIPIQYCEDHVSAMDDAIWIATCGKDNETAGISCDGDGIKFWSPMDDDPVFIDTDDGEAYPIMHTGNIDDYVLKLSGGTSTVHFNSDNLPQFSGSPEFLLGIEGFANSGTLKWQSASNVNVGSATTASRLYYGSISNNNSFATGLQAYFNSNKNNIPRNVGLSFYSSAYSNGSQLFGYWLQGNDSAPYGGFFACHYNIPKYIGINNGTYTEHTIVTSENIKDYTVGTADALTGFTRPTSAAGWGWMGSHSSTYTYLTAFNGVNSSGSECAYFHRSGQLSVQFDGTVFVNEGNYEVVYCQSYSNGVLTLNTVYNTH